VKRCTSCHRELPEDAFGNHSSRRSGKKEQCRDCTRQRQLHYRHTARGREQHRAANRRVRDKKRSAT